MRGRYWLSSTLGAGVRQPIPPTGLAVGRNDDNDLVLAHPSVSGRHARFELESEVVTVVDLGSTNGTTVDGRSVETRELAHADVIVLGQVELVFEDSQVAETLAGPMKPTRKRASGPAVANAGEGLRKLSDDALSGSGRRSTLLLVLFLVSLGAAGWAGMRWFDSQTGDGPSHSLQVVKHNGNLIGDPSFEAAQGVAKGWLDWEAGSATFFADRIWRNRGELGFGVELAGGQAARCDSPALRINPGQRLSLEAACFVEGPVVAQLGLAFENSSKPGTSIVQWASVRRGQDSMGADLDEGFMPQSMQAHVPPGFDRVRVVLAASSQAASGESQAAEIATAAAGGEADEGGVSQSAVFQSAVLQSAVLQAGGSVAFDDLVLLSSPASEPEWARFGEYEFWSDDSHSLVLMHVDKLRLRAFAGVSRERRLVERPEGNESKIEIEVMPVGFGVELSKDAGCLSFIVDGALAAERLAASGEEGYSEESAGFERRDVTTFLMGRGTGLLLLAFESPVSIQTKALGGADGDLAVTIELGSLRRLRIQSSFHEERQEAESLARKARSFEREGKLGQAFQAWAGVLDETPYEDQLVAEAQEVRSRLTREALDRTDRLRESFERAKFFRLADIYRRVAASASELAGIYAGTELETSILSFRAEVDEALAAFESTNDGRERERLERMASVFEREGRDELALHTRRELEMLATKGEQR